MCLCCDNDVKPVRKGGGRGKSTHMKQDGLFGSLGTCCKILLFCLGCLLLAGPVLLIVGIVLMALPNDRPDRVSEYNDFVEKFSAAAVENDWLPATVNSGTAFSVESQAPPVVGDLEDVNTADALSRYLLAAEVPYATQLNFVVSGATPSPISRTILPSVSRTAEAYCERNEGCVRSIMTQYCQTNYGTTASFTGSSDCAKGKCMQCAYTAFLTEFCIVLTAEKKAPEGGGAAAYEADPNFKSCYYPFAVTSQAFGATQQQAKLRVSVRKADDPFIALQRLTEGTSDFGLTKTQQYTTGLILLGIGIAMTVGLAGLVVFMIVHRSRQVGAVEAEEGATAGAGRNSNANRNTTNHHSNNGIAMHQLPAFSGGAGGGHNPQTFRTSQEDSQVFVTTGDNIFFPPPGAVGGAAGTPFADGPFAEATRESQASSSAPPPPGVAQGIPIRTVR